MALLSTLDELNISATPGQQKDISGQLRSLEYSFAELLKINDAPPHLFSEIQKYHDILKPTVERDGWKKHDKYLGVLYEMAVTLYGLVYDKDPKLLMQLKGIFSFDLCKYKTLHDTEDEASTRSYLGAISFRLDNLEEAEKMYTLAFEIYNKLSPNGQPTIKMIRFLVDIWLKKGKAPGDNNQILLEAIEKLRSIENSEEQAKVNRQIQYLENLVTLNKLEESFNDPSKEHIDQRIAILKEHVSVMELVKSPDGKSWNGYKRNFETLGIWAYDLWKLASQANDTEVLITLEKAFTIVTKFFGNKDKKTAPLRMSHAQVLGELGDWKRATQICSMELQLHTAIQDSATFAFYEMSLISFKLMKSGSAEDIKTMLLMWSKLGWDMICRNTKSDEHERKIRANYYRALTMEALGFTAVNTLKATKTECAEHLGNEHPLSIEVQLALESSMKN
jgi:tetratricopeptide (TPR) repeat protein